jgi:hypothetical protein
MDVELSLTSKEEHRLRVFENRVLRRISGPERVEVTGGWRKLRDEELHNIFFTFRCSSRFSVSEHLMGPSMSVCLTRL